MNRMTGIIVAAGAALVWLGGCGDDGMVVSPPGAAGEDKSLQVVRQLGDTPPGLQASVALDGQNLAFWPYTGRSFDGQPMDPINVIFCGAADPRQIRAALLALDGDRTAFGLPPVAPFDETWHDALGGEVQTAWSEGEGWVGSVVQLTLGEYGPLRVHLRLFRTGAAYEDGGWTLGGAHFELQIPGTADHQVLSWELAEQIVMIDMLRTGLVDPARPAIPTGVINAAPDFRTIPAMIYNLLPPELVIVIGGPPQPVTEDVPLASDGQGTMFDLVAAAPLVPGSTTRTVTVTYDQLVPRPYCATGPGDWLLVSGPVEFALTAALGNDGRYSCQTSYAGVLLATPMDMSGGQPVPVGPPFKAQVFGNQDGWLDAAGGRILAIDNRITREPVGPQILRSRLDVPQLGLKSYNARIRCFDGVLDPGT
jgi:hypothetical protein